jgi:hypothetical protein
VNVLNNFGGLVGDAAPDTCGAVGHNSYVESVNHSVSIYDKSGNTIASTDMFTFFFNIGGIILSSNQALADATSCYDEPIGRFIVADLEVTGSPAGTPSYLDLCVSTSSNPRTLTIGDWRMYQIPTSEVGLWSDYPGNLGYNQDALVDTFNMFDSSGNLQHTEVDALSQSDLANTGFGSVHYNQFDLSGQNYRPVTMHDSVAGGPMWFVQDTAGFFGGTSINLVRSDDILHSSAVHTFNVTVNSYGSVNAPLNPDGSAITPGPDGVPDTRILKAAEASNTIVACQNVGVGSKEDDARWYEFNVSNINNPTVEDQGNVGFGANTYAMFPAIDINEAGDIGMCFSRSGNDSPTDYMSVWVTGRTPTDAAVNPGQMETPVLERAGDSNDKQGREGDFSGINVDSDGSFWTATEFCTGGASGTQITHFFVADIGQANVDSKGVLQVLGSNRNDSVALYPKPGDSSQTQVVDNGLVLGDFANSSFSSINIALQAGDDSLLLADIGGSSGLGFFGVPVTVDGGTGNNFIVLDDSTSSNTNTYTVTGNTVSRNGFGGLTFTNLQQVGLHDGSGSNTVNVLSTSAFLTLQADGQDSVYVGSKGSALGGNLQGITGGVNVVGNGAARLTVDDGGDATGRTATLTHAQITGLAPAPIAWNSTSNATGGVIGLTIYGGSGGNTFTVTSTSNFFNWTFLSSGTGNDTVNVEGTNGLLLEDNPGGQDTVYVGSKGSSLGGNLQGIQGNLTVSANGATSLIVDDGGDTTGRTATMSGSRITGLAPATISWVPTSSATHGVTDLTVYGGSGGNTFTVTGTSNFYNYTLLNTGTGADYVNVEGTTGTLDVYNPAGGRDTTYIGSNGSSLGGTVQTINGPVYAYGAGPTQLLVDDSGDTTGRTATLSDGSITGLAPATINWVPTSSASGGVVYLGVFGGSGGNTFNVTNTSNFYQPFTFLGTGTGYDTVNVEGTTGALHVYNNGGLRLDVGSNGSAPGGNVQGIHGDVSASGPGATALYVEDDGDTTGRTATLYDGKITGLAPATIHWTPTSTGAGGVIYIQIDGGSGGNTFTVTGTSNLYQRTQLNTGSGNDTVNVEGTTGTLYIYNPGGQDSVYVGSNGSALGGNVQGIQGGVLAYGAGATSLVVDDSGDTTGRTAKVTDITVTGLGSYPIAWYSTSSASGGVTGLTVYGGSGGNTFNVTNTSSFYTSTTLSTGTGSDTVNVSATTGALNVVNPGGQDSIDLFSGGSVVNGTLANINGPVNVKGAGSTGLILGDMGDSTGRTVTLADGSITGLAPATISWTPSASGTGGVTLVAVYGGSGGSTYNVTNTSNLFNHTLLETGTSNDAVNIVATTGTLYVYNSFGTDTDVVGSLAPAPSDGTLAAIHGIVNITSGGTTNLTVDDSGDALARSAIVSNSAVTGLGNPAPIEYGGGVSSLTVNGSKAASTYTVQSTQAGTATTVNGAAANDAFKVGDATHPLSAIQGALTLNGGLGTNKVTLTDTAQSGNETYYVSPTAFTGGMAGISFTGMKGLTFNAGTGTVGLVVTAVATAVPVTFNGGGIDGLFGPNGSNTWAITGTNAGKLTAATPTGTTLGTVTFNKVQYLFGGPVADLFKLSPGKSLSGYIQGGSGIETLDYSLWTTGVSVNLGTDSATNILSGVFGVENINGGAGNDYLVGDAYNNIIRGAGGNDTIIGGGGNDILIGGQGAASLSAANSGRSILIGGKSTVAQTLTGSGQDDIIIGGYTSYDSYSLAHDQALLTILAEWTSGDSEAVRESKITSGIGPGAKDKFKLGMTVFGDGTSDTINGNGAEAGDTDWIINA